MSLPVSAKLSLDSIPPISEHPVKEKKKPGISHIVSLALYKSSYISFYPSYIPCYLPLIFSTTCFLSLCITHTLCTVQPPPHHKPESLIPSPRTDSIATPPPTVTPITTPPPVLTSAAIARVAASSGKHLLGCLYTYAVFCTYGVLYVCVCVLYVS